MQMMSSRLQFQTFRFACALWQAIWLCDSVMITQALSLKIIAFASCVSFFHHINRMESLS